jgi:hypothetical protein
MPDWGEAILSLISKGRLPGSTVALKEGLRGYTRGLLPVTENHAAMFNCEWHRARSTIGDALPGRA